MELIERIKNDLKENLTEYRYIHSLGVMEMAEELAKVYNVDVESARIAGLLHDIAKEMTKEESLEYVEKNNIAIDEVENLLKQNFRPEFLNRLDEIVFYKPLLKDQIKKIVDLMIESLRARLRDKQLDVVLTDRAKDYVINAGYDPVYGARPLRRFLQSKVETLIAKTIIAQDLLPDTKMVVDYDGEKLTIRTEQ